MLSSLNARWDQEGFQKHKQPREKINSQAKTRIQSWTFATASISSLLSGTNLVTERRLQAPNPWQRLVGSYKNSFSFCNSCLVSAKGCPCTPALLSLQTGWDNSCKGGVTACPLPSCSLRSLAAFIYMLTLLTSKQNTNGVGFFLRQLRPFGDFDSEDTQE